MAKKNNGPDPDKARKSLEYLKGLAESGFDFEKSMKSSNGILDSIANQLFGLKSSEFFEKIKVSTEQMSQWSKQASMLEDAMRDAAITVDKSFKTALSSARTAMTKAGQSFDDNMSVALAGLSKKMPEIAAEIDDAINSRNFSKLSESAQKEFRKLVADKEGFAKLSKFFDHDAIKNLNGIKKEMTNVNAQLDSAGKYVFAWDKFLTAIAERLVKDFSLRNIKTQLIDFDQILTEGQRNFGIAFRDNGVAMGELATYTQQFGMGIKDATEFMGKLSGVLRTTNFETLAAATRNVAAIKNATGLASEQVAELTGNMMLMGSSSAEVASFAERTMKSAAAFGVNGKKIMEDITKNMVKFRTMGFQGGEESLKKMALQAERMGQSMDELFDMSKRARNIEGALDMAAQLQLAGGSFAQINPLDLLSAARKGPQELQKILAQMGQDIGKFDKETGKMAFDAVDYDRLQMVADATGQSVDSLQKQITKMNQDAAKTELIPAGLFDSLNDEEKSFLLNQVGQNGQLTMKVDGVSEVAQLSKENIAAELAAQAKQKGAIEEQSRENTSFRESLKNLQESIMNAFVVFEPFIKALSSFVQRMNQMFADAPMAIKVALAVAIGGLALLFSSGKQFISGFAFGKGQRAGLAGGGAGGGGISSIAGAGNTPENGKPGGFLESLANGLKAFGQNPAQIIKGAATLAVSALMIGGALVAITAGIAAFGGDASGKQLLSFGVALVGLSGTMFLMSKIMGQISPKDILMGSLAMVTIGAAFIPFAFAMKLMEGVKWETLAMAAVGVIGLTAIVAGLGLIMSSGVGALILGAGVLFLVGLGVGMAALGGGLLVASAGFTAMSGVDWASLANLGPTVMAIAAAGALGLIGSFGLIGMAVSLGALAAIMVVLAPAMSLAATSTEQMAQGVMHLKEAIKGLDTSKLNELAEASEKMSVSSAIGGLANTLATLTGTGKAEKSIKLEPITINLKLNGRDLQTIIVDDTSIVT
jgi:hypothetical protein